MRELLLYVENLTVSFDGFRALDIDTFELSERELRVIIGPNGAGKTTFMDVLCGKTRPDTGKALMDGKDLTRLSEQQIVEAGVGRKFQTPTVFGSLSVRENLLLAHRADKGVLATLFARRDKRREESVLSVAESVGLAGQLPTTAAHLSHGQKQWLEIGMLMAMDPRLLLIDEPAAGMTDEETVKTGELLTELARRHAVIVIEHDMEFVRALDCRVTVLCEGRVLTEGPMDKVQADPEVVARYLGRSPRAVEEKA